MIKCIAAVFPCLLLASFALAGDMPVAARASVVPVAKEVASVLALVERCAPTVHPETMTAVISAESRGHQFAIADAGPVKLPWSERKHLVRSHYMGSLDEAEAKAKSLISNGHTVSLGLAQINDRNLPRLGMTIREVFDPCTNLSAGGKILTEFYERAAQEFGPGEKALRASISAYNSGSWIRGERNGYVGLVFKQAGKPLKIQTTVVVPRIRDVMKSPITPVGYMKTIAGRAVKADASSSENVRTFAISSRNFLVSE